MTRFEETLLAGPVSVCPVCQWPDEGRTRCGVCGWELIGDYVAGAATPADLDAMAGRLASARQDHDVRAAVRAVSTGGSEDPARLCWLASCARGGAPSGSQLQRIAAEVAGENGRQAELPETGYPVIRLLAGETDGLVFVEIGPDAVSACTLVADPMGVPRRRPAGDSQPWPGLLPGLPAETDLARFLLAGGIGAANPGGDRLSAPADGHAALPEVAGEAMARALAVITMAASAQTPGAAGDGSPGRGFVRSRAPRLDLVLVRRTVGWPVLDALARQAWLQARPVLEIHQPMSAGSLGDLVDQVVGRAPLRYAYDLILLEVSAPDGSVRLRPRELFAAGTVARPGQAPSRTVPVAPPPHAADVIELPVVARYEDQDAWWPLVESFFISGTDGQPTRLRVSLDGPGQLRHSAVPALVRRPPTGSRWPDLIDGLPSQLGPVRALDLAFLVELGGYHDGAVTGRIRLVREVIGALRTAVPDRAAQVAVLGYRDHYSSYKFRARAEHSQLVVHRGLSQAVAALSVLDHHDLWERVDVEDDYAAPLECALRKLAEDGLAWRPHARRVVLIVGSRPPHPAMPDNQGSLVRTCPEGSDWRRYVEMIRGDDPDPVRFLVVTDHPPHSQPRQYIHRAWQDFPAESIFPIETVSPAPLVQAIGLAPENGVTRLGLAIYAAPSAGYAEKEAADGRR